VLCSLATPDEPLAGSAPEESHWLFVEAPGTWGRDALATSTLSEPLRTGLAALPEHWRVVLARRPDRPLRRARDRMVWLTTPHGAWSWRLPLDAPVHPDALADGGVVRGEVLFLCTNGARDRCCALRGRGLLNALASPHVWECSHLGGHRFAPTGVRLRDRMVFGRLDERAAGRILAGATPLDLVRGPAGWPPQVQAGAVAVWRQHGVVGVAAARVSDGEVVLEMSDASAWTVQVDRVPLPARPLSCGAAPSEGSGLVAGVPVPIGG
jgi:hypothetical protein